MRIAAWTGSIERDQALLAARDIPKRIEELNHQGPHVALLETQGAHAATQSEAAIERWHLRDSMRVFQPGRQQRACGVDPVDHVHVGPGWQRGLATCKSVHSCPVCSARIRSARTDEVQRCMLWWTREQDQRIAMLTLTVRHAYVHDLRELRFGLTRCWSELWKTRRGRDLRSHFEHYVRALDITWGFENGWHPHLHVLLFVRAGALDDDWLADVQADWAHIVELHLGKEFRPRTDSVGVHLSMNPPRAEYLFKLGLELSQITNKTPAPGHLSPWQIGHAAVHEQEARTRDRTWRDRWRTWVMGMLGARHLTWSRDLRRLVDLPEEEPEQLELDLELAQDDGWVLSISAQDWRAIFLNGFAKEWTHNRRPSLLLGQSTGGLQNALAYLRSIGLEPHHVRRTTIAGEDYQVITMRRRTELQVFQC